VLFGKYQGEPGGRVVVSGFAGGGAPFTQALPVRAADARPANQALRWLWARSWVATLEDELAMGGGQPVEDAITDLGLRHSLLTPFTSFVAVDQEIANRTGGSTTVRQPLPMPEGVSNLAVASPAPSALKMNRMGMGAVGPSGHAGRTMAKRALSDDALEGLSSAAPERLRAVPPAPEPVEKTEKPREAERRPAPAVLRALVMKADPTDLAAPEQLRAAVEARLAKLTWPLASTPTGPVVLRLRVDGAGKVTAVELVSGDADLAKLLRAPLLGLTSGTKAVGREAMLVVTIRMSAG
jgi:Ca-activated chloride channel family protein